MLFGGAAGVGGGKGGSAGDGGAGGTGGMSGMSGMSGKGGSTGGGGAGGSGGKAGGGSGGSSGSGGAKCVVSLMPNQPSGNLGTTEVCFQIAAPLGGWQASNVSGRVITINGERVTFTGDSVQQQSPNVPDPVDDAYVFVFGAGSNVSASWSYWRP
jgi:hypothetical protein